MPTKTLSFWGHFPLRQRLCPLSLPRAKAKLSGGAHIKEGGVAESMKPKTSESFDSEVFLIRCKKSDDFSPSLIAYRSELSALYFFPSII